MKKVPLLIPFFLALAAALFATAFFPSARIFAFAPFLAILYMRMRLVSCLWISCLAGLVVDLLSSDLSFGVYSINYTLTTILLYTQKRHFFDDKPLALSLFTAIISSISTLLQFFLMLAFSRKLPLSLGLAVSDLVLMPCLDAAYAFLWFTCPIKLYTYVKRIGWKKIFSFKTEET